MLFVVVIQHFKFFICWNSVYVVVVRNGEDALVQTNFSRYSRFLSLTFNVII